MFAFRYFLQHSSEQKFKMPMTELEYIAPSLKL